MLMSLLPTSDAQAHHISYRGLFLHPFYCEFVKPCLQRNAGFALVWTIRDFRYTRNICSFEPQLHGIITSQRWPH